MHLSTNTVLQPALVVMSLPENSRRLSEHTDCAREDRKVDSLPAMGPFLPEFSCGMEHTFVNCTWRSGPKNFVLFFFIDMDYGGCSISWTT